MCCFYSFFYFKRGKNEPAACLRHLVVALGAKQKCQQGASLLGVQRRELAGVVGQGCEATRTERWDRQGREAGSQSREEGATYISTVNWLTHPWTVPALPPEWNAALASWEGDTPRKGGGSGPGKSLRD